MKHRHWARRCAAVGSAVLTASILAACGTGDEDGKDDKSDKPTKAAASTKIDPEAADPGHAVPAPGKLTGPQYGDDLLIVSDEGISADMLKKITSVKVGNKKRARQGVAAYQQLSLGQFSLDGRYYNIAAVDPGEYRRFTGQRSAQFQEQWDRIAGGEVAIAENLKKKLPLDKDDFLEVGKQRIHLGAWSPSEVDGVDAMVNVKWGKTLDLPQDNALLINTGIASPQAVRTGIEKAVGKKTLSITALDIVAQAGLDLDAIQQVVPVGAFSDAIGTFNYRPIGGGRIAPDPSWVSSHIVTEQVPILGRVTCNKFMMPQLKAALRDVVANNLASKIHPGEYAGCYYPRFIAGSTTLSNHSFGLALDFNVPGNQRGTVGQMDRNVVAIFKRWGFAWGGDWSYTDPMHFELSRIVNPG
ncbi:MAG: M15 family metallopeptidase [Nocardioidaceae bacterium]|nr:M15 family metallopeptidase [Nocardioidaceae bacterium]